MTKKRPFVSLYHMLLRHPGKSLRYVLFVLLAPFFIIAGCNHQQPPGEQTKEGDRVAKLFVYRVEIKGPITPSSMEFLQDSVKKAEKDGAVALLMIMDTPGGLVSSMDEMIRSILSSNVPILTYISPPGASCGSAGVYILYSSHIAAMAPATNIGSATPVMMGGGGGGEGEKGDKIPEEAGANDAVNLKRKQINHAIAQIRSLADYRNRNADFGERTITRAENVTSKEALRLKAIDFIADTEDELLEKADGRSVRMLAGHRILKLKNVEVRNIEADTRMEFLNVLSNPNLAYILMMIGVLGIIAEIQNPGMIFPGVIGAISLLLGLYAMQTLPVNYTGLALILLGLILFIAEIFTPTFGILTVAGFVSFVLGSFLLVDSSEEIYQISTALILSTSAGISVIAGFMIYKAAGTLRKKEISGDPSLSGQEGTASSDITRSEGKVYIHSEYWNGISRGETIPSGSKVRVIQRKGMTLVVEKIEQ